MVNHDDHDGIKTMLDLPDPVERRLALKSKQVQPYHLRMALADGDSEVRKLAALHPNLSPELISEVLSGDNSELKHHILGRPDLLEHHLMSVATDPKYALAVAKHPKTTDAVREKAIHAVWVPHGVRELHAHRLGKSIGFITYPLLGEGRVYTAPMHVDRETAKVRARYVGDAGMASGKNNGYFHSTYSVDGNQGLDPTERTLTSVILPSNKPKGLLEEGKRVNASENHEAQHSVFARIGQKYGHNAQLRVVATTLSKLQPHHRAHIHNLYSAHPSSSIGSATDNPEEAIAYLHNYLQRPDYRDRIHHRLGLHTEQQQRDSVQLARKAWNELRRIGNALRPEEVGIDPSKETDRISKWVKGLKKRESIPSDQLGFSVSFIEAVSICEFLTGRKIDQKDLRRAILNAGDGTAGILEAFGLNNSKGKKAFESVKGLRLHKSEDFLKAPRQVAGIDNDDIANEVIEAYAESRVKPVTLDGKHSSGSYMVEDSDGHTWLLKPGSGKKSPAAGVDETNSSQSKREAVFSAIAQWMGVSEVQPAFLLNIDGKEVAVIKMWPMDFVNLHKTMTTDPNLPRRALEPYRRSGEIFKWAVLDFVAGNPDRHGNNIMVGPEDQGNKIGLIDHGSSIAGVNFDPGNDQDSFIPYYLRVWAGPNFHTLSKEMQLKQMPTVSGEVDDSLRQWIGDLDPQELSNILYRYGIDPGPAVKRLQEVQADPMTQNMSLHINKLWLEDPSTALEELNQALEGQQR